MPAGAAPAPAGRAAGLTAGAAPARLGLAVAVAGMAVVSGAAGALAGAHPTGTSTVDPLLSGLLAALVTAAGAAAGRAALLAAGVVAVALSRRWMWLPSGAGLLLAFFHTIPERRRPLVGSLTAALAAQAMLRWPAQAFLGLPSLVAGVVSVVVVASACRRLPRRPRRWLLGISSGLAVLAVAVTAAVAVSLLQARAQLDGGVSAARSALRDMGSDRMSAAVRDLSSASTDLAGADRRVSAWWLRAGRVIPLVAQQQRAVAEVSRAGHGLTASAAAAARSLQGRRFEAGRGMFDLAAIRAVAAPVQGVAAALDRTGATLEAVRSPWLVAPIQRRLDVLGRQLQRYSATAGMAASALRQAPVLLGGSGVQRYLVVFTNPAEDRGLGGFIAAYAVVAADQGRLTMIRQGRAPLLQPPPGSGASLRGEVQYLDRYSAFDPQGHFQDLTYSPDFPTVDQVISQLYPQMQGGAGLDGVLMLDPYALQAILRFTGPVAVPGLPQPLTATDAADVLLRQQYLMGASSSDASRHDVLQEALAAGFNTFMRSRFPSPRALLSALEPMAEQGRLSFWTADRAVQPLLRRAGLAGAFPRPGPSSDVLAVTLSNYDNNKIDAYLHESVRDDVVYDPATGAVRSRLTVDLRNDADAAGLPAYVVGSFPGSGLASGVDKEWLTLYTPLGVTSASFGGRPFHLSGPLPELGVMAYSGYVEIPPGGTGRLVVSLAGRLPAGPRYSMSVRLQPLANPVSAEVSLRPTSGWTAPRSWTLGPDAVQSRTWKLPATTRTR